MRKIFSKKKKKKKKKKRDPIVWISKILIPHPLGPQGQQNIIHECSTGYCICTWNFIIYSQNTLYSGVWNLDLIDDIDWTEW